MVYVFKCLTGKHSVKLWGWVKAWLDMRKVGIIIREAWAYRDNRVP